MRTRHVAGVEQRRGGGVVVTAGGLARVKARAAVLAVNWRTIAWAPFARELSAASSHIVLTEPVPDVLAEVGWSGGEALSDCRRMLHYFRTTKDGRIAFGWGGGRMTRGVAARLAPGHRHRGRRPRPPRRCGASSRRSERPRDHARLGRPDRRRAQSPPDLPLARRPACRLGLHRPRRRALAPRRPDPLGPGARRARRGHDAAAGRPAGEALPARARALTSAAR